MQPRDPLEPVTRWHYWLPDGLPTHCGTRRTLVAAKRKHASPAPRARQTLPRTHEASKKRPSSLQTLRRAGPRDATCGSVPPPRATLACATRLARTKRLVTARNATLSTSLLFMTETIRTSVGAYLGKASPSLRGKAPGGCVLLAAMKFGPARRRPAIGQRNTRTPHSDSA